MQSKSIKLINIVIAVTLIVHLFGYAAIAGEKEERIRLLQEKMEALKAQLSLMQEEELRQQPPTEMPWQPLKVGGEERKAYAQYVYLLGSQMAKEELDATLQQVYYLASQDPMEERGALFVVPALPLTTSGQMTVDNYNRELAVDFLTAAGIPSAVEGGLLVSARPLAQVEAGEEELLFIDLSGGDRILKSRILELLQTRRLFEPDGTVHAYLWALLKSASPQSFNLYWRNGLAWLSVAAD